MSPEQIDAKHYNEKSDIWSLGCLVYELVCLCPPFNADNIVGLAMKIRGGRYRKLPMSYSSQLAEAIQRMLQVNAAQRCSIDNIVELPFLQPYVTEARLQGLAVSLKQWEQELDAHHGMLEAKQQEIARHTRQMDEELAEHEARVRRRTAEIERIEEALRQRELAAAAMLPLELSASGLIKNAVSGSHAVASDAALICDDHFANRQRRPFSSLADAAALAAAHYSCPPAHVSAACLPPLNLLETSYKENWSEALSRAGIPHAVFFQAPSQAKGKCENTTTRTDAEETSAGTVDLDNSQESSDNNSNGKRFSAQQPRLRSASMASLQLANHGSKPVERSTQLSKPISQLNASKLREPPLLHTERNRRGNQ